VRSKPSRRVVSQSRAPPAVVSCHVERPLDDAAWHAFARFQRARPGGFRIAALMRPPSGEDGEREDIWLERVAVACAQGPLGHHTHFGGVERARPSAAEVASDRLRAEAEWLRERDVLPRFWCGGGWFLTPSIAGVLRDLEYVDCTATAFKLRYLASGAPHLHVREPRSLLLADGRALLELPVTHTLGMAARLAVSPRAIGADPVHVYFHDWELLDRARSLALRAVLILLGRRCRPSDLEALAGEVRSDALELPFTQ
jgi:hypothetical protein